MLQTNYGLFNGKSWEDLCQLVFKLKHSSDGYQHIQADPGDFGLEGYTIHSGHAFQCYCPEKHYTTSDLYAAQRDKITADLSKLKKHEKEIAKRIGTTRISDWFFVSPIIEKNALLTHAKVKEAEVRTWNLGILTASFAVHLRDADFYAQEIQQVRTLEGKALIFDIVSPKLPELTGPQEEYEGNIRRKSELRLDHKKDQSNFPRLVGSLYQETLASFLTADGYLRRIEEDAPMVFANLCRIINEFEFEVREAGITWQGTPEALTSKIRESLAVRVKEQLQPNIDATTAQKISRHIVARWLAVCELDFQ